MLMKRMTKRLMLALTTALLLTLLRPLLGTCRKVLFIVTSEII